MEHKQMTIGISPFSPKGKQLSREEMLDWVKNVHLENDVYFLRWDYPENAKYNMIEVYFSEVKENE